MSDCRLSLRPEDRAPWVDSAMGRPLPRPASWAAWVGTGSGIRPTDTFDRVIGDPKCSCSSGDRHDTRDGQDPERPRMRSATTQYPPESIH